jgi:hypothetical protein
VTSILMEIILKYQTRLRPGRFARESTLLSYSMPVSE